MYYDAGLHNIQLGVQHADQLARRPTQGRTLRPGQPGPKCPRPAKGPHLQADENGPLWKVIVA